MTLLRARRTVRMGLYACPALCVGIAVAAWKQPVGGSTITSAMALALGAAIWALLQLSARWMEQAGREREDMHNQLIQSQKILALGEISTGIAHEINNPLCIIAQETELIRVNLSPSPSPEALEEIGSSLDVIDGQVSRCSGITHKLLDFARHRKTVAQLADVNRLLEDMIALVERDTGSKNIQVVRLLDRTLPQVVTDPPLLRQVYLNILINAAQAVRENGFIFVSTYISNGKVCAEIRDTGPGIPREDRERIFNPFFTTKQPGEGTGLGLAVSLRIINELGGSISVDSPSQEHGAQFSVCIPAKTGGTHDDKNADSRS